MGLEMGARWLAFFDGNTDGTDCADWGRIFSFIALYGMIRYTKEG